MGLFALNHWTVHTFAMSSDSVHPFAPPGSLRPPTATVKLGGSLLDLTDLAVRLDRLRPDWGERPLLVVGGGPAADLVREWDRRHCLGETKSHWLALDSLVLTSQLLTQLWPITQVAAAVEIDACWQQQRVPVVLSREWFEYAEQARIPAPPQNWNTTTDTIAAWIASVSRSETLWLLKSVTCPASLPEATRQNLIDIHFSAWVPPRTPLYWANLREMTWGRIA